jgi:Protein of unknown function (DUF2795)
MTKNKDTIFTRPEQIPDTSVYFNHTNPIEVATYLKGLDYPTDKQHIIKCAQQNSATPKVLKVINEFPDKVYDSPFDIAEEVTNFRHYQNSLKT